MKYLILLLSFCAATSVFADSKPFCINPEAILLIPCEDVNEKHYFYQGSCEAGKAQEIYCASEEMTDLRRINSDVSIPEDNDREYIIAFLNKAGMLLHVKSNEIKSCENASILIGKSKEAVDNYDPSKGEIGIGDSLLSFNCLD